MAWILCAAVGPALHGPVFTVIDGWSGVHDAHDDKPRRVVSLYRICTKIALILSPLEIGFGTISVTACSWRCALMCLSLIPVSAHDDPGSLPPPARPPARLASSFGPCFVRAPSAVRSGRLFAVGR